MNLPPKIFNFIGLPPLDKTSLNEGLIVVLYIQCMYWIPQGSNEAMDHWSIAVTLFSPSVYVVVFCTCMYIHVTVFTHAHVQVHVQVHVCLFCFWEF